MRSGERRVKRRGREKGEEKKEKKGDEVREKGAFVILQQIFVHQHVRASAGVRGSERG